VLVRAALLSCKHPAQTHRLLLILSKRISPESMPAARKIGSDVMELWVLGGTCCKFWYGQVRSEGLSYSFSLLIEKEQAVAHPLPALSSPVSLTGTYSTLPGRCPVLGPAPFWGAS